MNGGIVVVMFGFFEYLGRFVFFWIFWYWVIVVWALGVVFE